MALLALGIQPLNERCQLCGLRRFRPGAFQIPFYLLAGVHVDIPPLNRHGQQVGQQEPFVSRGSPRLKQLGAWV